MKEVYLLRHAQLAAEGSLTPAGILRAQAIGQLLPKFDMVVTAGDPVTDQTVQCLLGDTAPDILSPDPRAGISPSLEEFKQEIVDFELPPRMNIVDYLYSDGPNALQIPLGHQASELSDLRFDMRDALPDDGRGLIVSYGLLIARMIHGRGLRDEPIAHCHGYVLGDNLSREPFAPALDALQTAEQE